LLLSHLAPMPSLTKLEIGHYDWGGCVQLPYMPGRVLARFQSLQQLSLDFVLDLKQWNEDVRSLAVLTNLRALKIRTGEFYLRVTNDELMPLTTLKQLRKLDLYKVVPAEADFTKFRQAMQAIRRDMGFSSSGAPPPAHSTWLDFEF
jgi:hypothetical protein